MRRTVILSGSGVALLGAVLAFGAWTALRSEAPAPASLAEALRQATPPAPRPIGLAPTVPTPELASVPASGSAVADSAGRWAIVAGPSFVGYRVKENLAGLGTNVAVGRSNDFVGTFAFDGRSVSELDVTANLEALKSDDDRRDGQLRTQALESARFPSARFVIATPFSIGAVPAEGDEAHVILIGDLTLHGVTRPVTAHIYGTRKGELVVVVGQTEVLFSDFGISPPQSIVLVLVEDHAVVEFQLIFKKA